MDELFRYIHAKLTNPSNSLNEIIITIPVVN